MAGKGNNKQAAALVQDLDKQIQKLEEALKSLKESIVLILLYGTHSASRFKHWDSGDKSSKLGLSPIVMYFKSDKFDNGIKSEILLYDRFKFFIFVRLLIKLISDNLVFTNESLVKAVKVDIGWKFLIFIFPCKLKQYKLFKFSSAVMSSISLHAKSNYFH